jgi:hypothetical protein
LQFAIIDRRGGEIIIRNPAGFQASPHFFPMARRTLKVLKPLILIVDIARPGFIPLRPHGSNKLRAGMSLTSGQSRAKEKIKRCVRNL